MIVHCFLQPPSLAQIHRALPRPHRVHAESTWEALVSGLQSECCDVAVVDPCVGSSDHLVASRLATLASVIERRPAIPIVGYVSVTASAMRAVQGLVRLGTTEIIIRGIDDSTQALSATLHRSVAASSASRLVHAVRAPLESLPSTVTSAIQEAFRRPTHLRSVEEFAVRAKMTRRSLDRWLARAGLCPARTVLACARVNAAFDLLAVGNVRLRDAATSLGYPSSRALIREVHAVTGHHASELTGELSRDAFVALVGRRLLRATSDAAAARLY